jgi:hypothetical protein
VSDTGNPSWLFNHNDKIVNVHDSQVLNSHRLGQRISPKLDDVFRGHFAKAIHAQIAVDLNVPTANRSPNVPPTRIGQALFQDPFQDLTIVLSIDMDTLKCVVALWIHTAVGCATEKIRHTPEDDIPLQYPKSVG